MFSPCSLETCGMLVPGGSFLGNREASQMRSHVGPCFFWKDGAALIFFGCFYVSKLLDNVGFVVISGQSTKKGHASETSFKDGLIASVPTIRSETPNRTSREFPFLRPTALLLLSTPVFQVGLPPLFLETCLVC